VSPPAKQQRRSPENQPERRTGRHANAHRTELRFTEGAFDDLVVLQKKNRQALQWAMKKFVLIERNPEAGAPLGGGLHGFRKLTVGDRDWRIIWRVTYEQSGDVIIDIGEIWAVGARKDAEVYAEMNRRVVASPRGPQTKALGEVLSLLEAALNKKRAPRATATAESTLAPQWLVDDLVTLAGYDRTDAATLTESEALAAWVAFRSRTIK
jgi:mRNA interferase RelE/StbE